MNLIFNSHFSGSRVWDLFSPEAIILENTWNKSIRLMFELPLQTHIYFICPVSESKHIRSMLLKRFVSFTQKLEASKKKLLSICTRLSRIMSIIGSNSRNILLLLEKKNDHQLTPLDIQEVKCHPVEDDDKWKVEFLKELVEIKYGDLVVDFEREELDKIIEHLCNS